MVAIWVLVVLVNIVVVILDILDINNTALFISCLAFGVTLALAYNMRLVVRRKRRKAAIKKWAKDNGYQVPAF